MFFGRRPQHFHGRTESLKQPSRRQHPQRQRAAPCDLCSTQDGPHLPRSPNRRLGTGISSSVCLKMGGCPKWEVELPSCPHGTNKNHLALKFGPSGEFHQVGTWGLSPNHSIGRPAAPMGGLVLPTAPGGQHLLHVLHRLVLGRCAVNKNMVCAFPALVFPTSGWCELFGLPPTKKNEASQTSAKKHLKNATRTEK